MRIIGFNLLKISADRKDKLEGKLEIKQNINIDNVSKDKLNITPDDVLKIDFTFNIDYSPDFANIEFKGSVVLLPEKEELKKIIKSWKNKEVPDDVRIPLFNFIMGKCSVKALSLADELGLPLHLPMPRLNPNQQ